MANANPSNVPVARTGMPRGCGTARIQGAVYLESGVGNTGLPLEQFLYDPPQPFDPDRHIGVDIVPDGKGTYHVIDWVGEAHYPMPTDFLEEGRQHGFSRKVSRNLEFDKLTANSLILFAHAKAIITNAAELAPYLPEHRLRGRCAHFALTEDETHFNDPNTSCTRHWYALAEANSTRANADGSLMPVREVAKGTTYPVEALPADAPAPKYRPGLIARVPISNISVVANQDGSHKATAARISQIVTGIPVLERAD